MISAISPSMNRRAKKRLPMTSKPLVNKIFALRGRPTFSIYRDETLRNSRAFWIANTDWGRKGLQKLDHFGAKLPGRFSTHHQPADDPLVTQQRHDQAGAEAEALEHLAHPQRVVQGPCRF